MISVQKKNKKQNLSVNFENSQYHYKGHIKTSIGENKENVLK